MNSTTKQKGLISTVDFDPLGLIENNISDIICIHDPDGYYRYVTGAVGAILGYLPAELIGTSPYEYFHPDDIEGIRSQSHTWALAGRSAETRIEYRFRKKDGSYSWLQTQTTPILGSDGSITKLLTVSRDINDRKLAEQALQDNERSYRQLFMSSPAVKLIIDPITANIINANQATVDFYGYTFEELQTMTIFQINLGSPEDIIECLSKVSKDYCKSIPAQHRLKDGSIRDVEIYSGPVNIKGKLLLHSIIIDVTARKQVEELYLESEKRVRDFAEAVPDVSFIFDEDGQYIEVFGNEDLLSKPKEQYRGLSVYQVLQEEDANVILSEIRQVITSGEKRAGVREMKIGLEKRFILGRTVPLSYKVNGKNTVAVIATDITEQRRTERMLQVTYELRRRSDFIHDVLNGRESSDENLAYLSNKIGFDLSLPIFACNFLSDKFNFNQLESQGEGVHHVQKFKDIIMDAFSDIPNSVAWDCREGIGILYQATFKAGKWTQSKVIAGLFRDKLLECDANIVVSVGVSDVHTGIQGLKNSCRQALSAAIAARCQVVEGTDIVHYREAGIFQFIPELLGRDAAKEYIERNIGKLIAYDRERKINYLVTLEEILRGSSVRQTADKQFLHPKTIVFRQKRIEKILDINLNDYQTRLALAVAIQLYKLNNI